MKDDKVKLKFSNKMKLLFLKKDIEQFFTFIKWLPSYFKLHKNYGYKPDTYDFIIQNYESVLCERTKLMSKPTYHWKDVVREIDRWYEDMEDMEYQKEYKQLEEQGLILKLPCKVGDKVWVVYRDNIIEEHLVVSIKLGENNDTIYFEDDCCYSVWNKDYDSLSKWMFRTEEEAKERLKELNK